MNAWTQPDWKERYDIVKRAGIQKPTRDMLIRARSAEQLATDGSIRFIGIEKDGTKRFEVKSMSIAGKVYHVSFNHTYATYCDCKDWRKHDKALADAGIPFSLHQCKHGLGARKKWQDMQQGGAQ